MGATSHRRRAVRAVRHSIMIWGIAVTCALLLASCSAGSSAGSAPTAPSGTAIAASTLARLKATVTAAESVPPFAPPGPAVSASVVAGKTAYVMPSDSEIDSCTTQALDFQQLGQQLGMTVNIVTNQGQPAQWVAGVQTALNAHAAAMAMLCGVPPQVMVPQLQAATSAGMAVVDGNYNYTNYYTGLDGETAVETATGVAQDVDDALVNLGGQALHALVVSTNSIVQGTAGIAAVPAEEKRVCPKVCTVDNVIVPIQDWATQVQPEVHKALASHPDINAVIIIFDGMVQFAAPAVEQAHRLGLRIYTWGASRTVESYMLQKGSLIAADPGPNNEWAAYQVMDQLLRLLGGHPAAPLTTAVIPDRFWTPVNVAQFFGPGGSYGNEGYGGNAFINGFRQLWGLPPASGS